MQIGSDTKTQLLEAANRVVLRDGANNLTLEAVAKEASISKGGLLYHYPNKQALLQAMLERQFAPFVQVLNAPTQDHHPGRFTRTYLRHGIPNSTSANAAPLEVALAAVLALEPELLKPIQDQFALWQSRLETDGLDPAIATIVRLCADGLYFAALFNLGTPNAALTAQVVQTLETLMDPKS
jgi:AcrR family transcriptional regulator